MAKLLLDSNILIDALRGLPQCEDYLSSLTDDEVFCSVVTMAELWVGVQAQEAEDMDIFLGAFRWVQVTEDIAKRAGQYVRQFSKSHGVRLPDALVAASAHTSGADLVTLNTRHFPMKDIRVVRPYSA